MCRDPTCPHEQALVASLPIQNPTTRPDGIVIVVWAVYNKFLWNNIVLLPSWELGTGNYPGQFTDQSMTLSQLCPLPPELVWMQLKTETCSGAEPELVSSVLDAQSSDSQLFQVTERSDRRRKLHQTVVVQIPERKRDTWEMTNWEYLLWTGTVSLDWD